MCTAIIDVPSGGDGPVRLLAIRDEDPQRPWNPLGSWWPERPGLTGVQDVRAGGAWLAADPDAGRVAVLLNRAGGDDLPDAAVVSRGILPLDAAAGSAPPELPRMRGFNLLEAAQGSARVVSCDGSARRVTEIPPGTHMLAHDDLDDPATARIAHWLEAFRSAPPAADGKPFAPWLEVLARSAALAPTDDRAIIRDNRPLGFPTLSLVACAATIDASGAHVRCAELPAPGRWGALDLR